MTTLSREWHLAHPMPKRPTLDERIAWHFEHAAHCNCREIPPTLLAEMRRRGLTPPEPPATEPRTSKAR